jgi:GT2 family glycosyltransferase
LSEAAPAQTAVSLIVVNHQGGDRVGPCLESLVAGADAELELFAVDNASTDGSLETMRRFAQGHARVEHAHPQRHARVEVVASPENLGYAGAVNLVLDRCAGRYIAVLNMDLVAEPGWLAPLVAHLDAHPKVAAVNPLLLLEDGERVNATGLDLHVTGLAFNRDLGVARASIPDAPFHVDGVQGAVFVCRRDVLLRMGGLDESGFLYHEDVWLSWALRSQGFEIDCVPRSALRHAYRLSMHADKLYLLERNRWALLDIALSGRSRLLLLPMLLCTEAMLLGYACLRGPRFVAAKLRAMRDAVRDHAARAAAKRAWRARSRIGDFALLRGMRWGYAWGQFGTLARERGAPRRPFRAPKPPAR